MNKNPTRNSKKSRKIKLIKYGEGPRSTFAFFFRFISAFRSSCLSSFFFDFFNLFFPIVLIFFFRFFLWTFSDFLFGRSAPFRFFNLLKKKCLKFISHLLPALSFLYVVRDIYIAQLCAFSFLRQLRFF